MSCTIVLRNSGITTINELTSVIIVTKILRYVELADP